MGVKNKILIKLISSIVITIFGFTTLSAQSTINVGICMDASTDGLNIFSENLKKEILSLSEFNYKFTVLTANMDTVTTKNNLQLFMNDKNIDYVIAVGYISSKQLSELKNYSKPTIASTILDNRLQELTMTPQNSSGINNFTYIESIIDLKKDLYEFVNIFEAKNVAIVIPEIFRSNFSQLDQYFSTENKKLNISIVSANSKSDKVLNQLKDSTDAAMILPLVGFKENEIQSLFEGLNKKHIPSLSVKGVNYLKLGATATLTPDFTFQQLARQIALRVMKISEGANPSELNVELDHKHVSMINMESVMAMGKFPKWNVLNESILINVTNLPSSEDLNLRLAISEALEKNLKGKMALKDYEIAEKEVKIARANALPQLSIGGSAVGLSNNLVEASMGQKGEFTLTGSASIKQVIYSESVFANLAISKLMAKSKGFYNEQAVLDVVSETSVAYISLLFAKSNLLIQNENVNTTTKNLQMAKSKEAAGQTGITDVNRWISELNMNKMKFNDAYTSYRNSIFNINQILNNDINNSISITDSSSIDETIFIDEDLLKGIFENPVLTDRYASFIIEEMLKNSPEIHQLETMAEMVERKSNLYKKQWFMPELAAFGGADQAFIRNGTIKPVGMPVPPPPDDMTFNYGVSLKIPLFQGGKSSAEAKKALIELDKINYQKEELYSKLQTGIRSNIQKLRTSSLELELSKNAAEAAETNFKMVRDAYFQGAVDLIKLIDAQNVMIRTKHMANISYYQYVLDYLLVERYQGKFNFLSTAEEQKDYINRLQNYLLKK
jgi:outer membrane protein TolC